MRWTLTALVVGVLIGQCTQLYAYLPVESNDDWYSSGDETDEDGIIDDNEVFPRRQEVWRPAVEDEDDGSGSGVTVFPSKCEEIRDGLTYPTSYRPQCTADGEFAPVQCHREYGECWCVDRDGIETAVERTRYPVRPDCGTVPTRDDTGGGDFGFETTTIQDTHRTSPERDEVQKHPVSELREFILNEPLFLAAIIGGAVLILLLIILILMFIVYRMRKKDEGSYSLDEPRHSFSYTRAKDQEFFA